MSCQLQSMHCGTVWFSEPSGTLQLTAVYSGMLWLGGPWLASTSRMSDSTKVFLSVHLSICSSVHLFLSASVHFFRCKMQNGSIFKLAWSDVDFLTENGPLSCLISGASEFYQISISFSGQRLKTFPLRRQAWSSWIILLWLQREREKEREPQ